MVLVIWLNENVLHLQTGQDFRLILAVMQVTPDSYLHIYIEQRLQSEVTVAAVVEKGAKYGTRTRDPRLGKPMLYQLS